MSTNYGERPGANWLETLPVYSAKAMREAMREHDRRVDAMVAEPAQPRTMSTNQVSFQILESGKGGLKVVRTIVGRSVRVYVSRTGSFAQDESACMRYLHRVKVNGMGPAFASAEEVENMRAAALAINLQELKRGQRATDAMNARLAAADDDRMACRVCGKPVDEDDACDEHLDVHSDCEPEFIAMRADAAVDRMIDAALLGEV